MKYLDARAYALQRLQSELSSDLYYHGAHHTIDVCQATDKLASAEGIKGKDLILLQTAAIFHDIGFVEQYHRHEIIGCDIVERILPQFEYTGTEVKIIQHIIQATQIPQRPQNLLQEVMCDADLDYLGRDDFYEIADTLRQEWEAYSILDSTTEWCALQVEFLEQHCYFTHTSQCKRGSQKKKHLSALKKLL